MGYQGDLTVECLPKVDCTPPPAVVIDRAVVDSHASDGAGSLPALEAHVSGAVSEADFSSLFERAANVLLPLI